MKHEKSEVDIRYDAFIKRSKNHVCDALRAADFNNLYAECYGTDADNAVIEASNAFWHRWEQEHPERAAKLRAKYRADYEEFRKKYKIRN